jgi:hypothetical protein
MTDISSPSVPASQNSTGEPATPPSGPHVASSRYRGATEGHNRTRPRRVRDSVRRTLRQRSRRRPVLLRRARRCAGQHGAGSYSRSHHRDRPPPIGVTSRSCAGDLDGHAGPSGRLTTQFLSLDGGTTTTHSSLSGPGASKTHGMPLTVSILVMPREPAIHGWLWRAGRRARGSSGAYGGSSSS